MFRWVAMTPTLERAKRSRFTRKALKFVLSASTPWASPVWMFMSPIW